MNRKETFTFNCNTDFPDLWVIESIKNPNGSDRNDGRYPLRVGCTVAILLIGIGKPIVWSYLADSNGEVKSGVWQSGKLFDVFYDLNSQTLYANSQNSYYALKKLPQKWGEIYADRCIGLPDWYPDYLGIVSFTVRAK